MLIGPVSLLYILRTWTVEAQLYALWLAGFPDAEGVLPEFARLVGLRLFKGFIALDLELADAIDGEIAESVARKPRFGLARIDIEGVAIQHDRMGLNIALRCVGTGAGAIGDGRRMAFDNGVDRFADDQITVAIVLFGPVRNINKGVLEVFELLCDVLRDIFSEFLACRLVQ